MLVASLLVGILGILFLVLGYLLWKKEKISLLHNYHHHKVAQTDKKIFCTLSGIGVLCIGIGLLLTAVLLVMTDSVCSFLAFSIGFLTGLFLLCYAGNRYNK